MTELQMLEAIERKSATDALIRAHLASTPSATDTYAQHSKWLEQGKCPLCKSMCDWVFERGTQMICFTCQSNPTFHEFRRSQDFIMRD